MYEMKYVVVSSKEQGEQLFIFPNNISHHTFADSLSYIRFTGGHNWERIFRKPIAAGFTDGLTCYGYSETLNLSSRKEDTLLLADGGASLSF